MHTLMISDITLRSNAAKADAGFSFKEKIEIAKKLDNIGVDVIETAPITNKKTDVLFLHTITPLVKNSVISCPVGYTQDSINTAWEAIKGAVKPRLHVMIPTSTVQLEYVTHKKPAAAIEMAKELIEKAKSLCADVEFSALDATRSEPDFLYAIVKTAIDAGASTITLCDTAGLLLPEEFSAFVAKATEAVPEMKNVNVSVECSEVMSMGVACEIASIGVGVSQIKAAVGDDAVPSLEKIAYAIKTRGDSIGVSTKLNQTVLTHSARKIMAFTSKKSNAYAGEAVFENNGSEITLNKNDDIRVVAESVRKLGYDLSEEDIGKVYESFLRLAEKKAIGAKELDAIVASAAMQVSPTYKLNKFVINSGNIITATANVELEKDGKTVSGISAGDGPIDAAFMAIEQIIGHHFELDDFQIQAVTEGREAVGEAVVKLRANGKLYSGRGISTDIIGASISAYISALNKICFEEA